MFRSSILRLVVPPKCQFHVFTHCANRQSDCDSQSAIPVAFIARLLDDTSPFQLPASVADGLPRVFATPEPGRLETAYSVRRSNAILILTRSC
jgi:hypothetical protein